MHAYSSLSEDQRALVTELDYAKMKAMADDPAARHIAADPLITGQWCKFSPTETDGSKPVFDLIPYMCF